MKSPGVIYRKYRQLKRRILYEKVQEAKKRLNKNCFYSKAVDIVDKDKTIKTFICLYDKNENKLEVCNHPEECNAFAYKFTRKDIEQAMNDELKDTMTRIKKYPELNMLEWVLDKTLDDAVKEPSILVKFIVLLIEFLENIIKFTAKDQKRLMENK